jgi:hypothetical protein
MLAHHIGDKMGFRSWRCLARIGFRSARRATRSLPSGSRATIDRSEIGFDIGQPAAFPEMRDTDIAHP